MTRTMLACLSCAFLRSRETMASTTASRPKFANGSERRNRRRPAACVATKPTEPTRKRISETASTGPVLVHQRRINSRPCGRGHQDVAG